MMALLGKTLIALRNTPTAMFACGVIALLLCATAHVTQGAESTPVAASVERANVIRAAVANVAPSLVRIETIGGIVRNERTTSGDSTSTGVIVAADGHIIVSSHTLRHEPRSILALLDDGTRYAATIVAHDRTRGLTLLKINAEGPLAEPAIVAPDELRVGQTAIAVGRAIDPQEPNLSVGIISALGRAGGRAIQTDANTSRNHYGGALVDLQGRLIGIVVPVAPLFGGIVANLDLYDSGIGFAVPATQVHAALDRLKEGIDLLPGKLGVGLETATTIDAPAVIALCRPNSDAFRQGVTAGDRIVAIDGHPVDRYGQVADLLAAHYAGDTVAVTLQRDDVAVETNIELLAKIAAYEPPVIGVLPKRIPLAAETDDTETDDTDADDVDEAPVGVAIRTVLSDSPASDAGIRPGDRVMAVGSSTVTSAAELRSQLEQQRVGDTVTLSLARDNEQLDVDVTLTGATSSLDTGSADTGSEAKSTTDSDADADADAETAALPDTQLLDIPGIDPQAVVFSPGDDTERGQCGLIVWVNDKEDVDLRELLSGWRDTCAGQRWTVVGVTIASEPDDATPDDATPDDATPDDATPDDATPDDRLAGAIEFCRDHFRTSADRTVLVAHGSGVLSAWQTAVHRGDLCRGVMAIEPTQIGPIRELTPGRTFEVFLTTSGDAKTAKGAEAVVRQLRRWKYPTTVTSTAEPIAAPPVAPTAEMIRWLDMVDRL